MPLRCQPRPWDTALTLLRCITTASGLGLRMLPDGDALGPACPDTVWHVGWDRVRRRHDKVLHTAQAMPQLGLKPLTDTFLQLHVRNPLS